MNSDQKTPLAKRLGIKPGFTVCVLNPPVGYMETLMSVPLHAQVVSHEIPDADIIHFFASSKKELEDSFSHIKELLGQRNALWVSWEKAEEAELTTDLVRSIGRKNGMADVKICAIDDVWSGIKFVYKLQQR